LAAKKRRTVMAICMFVRELLSPGVVVLLASLRPASVKGISFLLNVG
jgi:hypothetical protein